MEKISLLVNCVFVFPQRVSDPPLCLGSHHRLPKHNGGSDFEITRGKRKEKKGRKGGERGGKRGGRGAGRVGGMWGDHRGDLGLSGCAVGVSGRRRDGLRGPWESRLHCQRLVRDGPPCSLAAGNMPGRPGHTGSIQVPAWQASSDVPVASPLARRSKSPPSLCACQRPRGSIVMAGCGNVPVGKLSGGLIRIKLASPGGGPSCYKPEPRCPLSCGAANFRLS